MDYLTACQFVVVAGIGDPTFATTSYNATEGTAFDETLAPTFATSPIWEFGSRAFLDTINCDALPSGLSYVQDGVENGAGVAPTYQISGTPAVGSAGTYTICFTTDDNQEGWVTLGTSQAVTITVAADTPTPPPPPPVENPTAESFGSISGVAGGSLSADLEYTSANFVWSGTATVSAIGLPDGLTLIVDYYFEDGSPALLVTGTPSAAGDYTTQVTITDGGQVASFNQTFNIAAPPAPLEPINTDSGSCAAGIANISNTVAYWDNICDDQGGIGDGGTTNTNDAYDGFGDLHGVNADGSTFIIGGSLAPTGAGTNVSYTSSYIWSHDAQEYVDVVVDRTFVGNTVTWTVNVYKTGTNAASTLTMYIDGNLGSDEGTTWRSSNGYLTSGDQMSGDPVIIWNTDGSIVNADGNDDVTINFVNASTATLENTFVGYTECVDQASMDAAVDAITANYASNVNTDIADVDTCVAPITPTVTVDNNVTFVNGTDDAQDVTVTADGDWNWTNGGSISMTGLPNGLSYTVIDEGVSDVVPSFQVTGIADAEPGDYTVTITLVDDYGNSAEATFVVTVEAAPVVIDASLSLNQPVGSNIADTGADYAAEGLLTDSEWNLTLRSTPQVIASGTVGIDGIIGGTATIPAGLEAGWHSITLTGTDVNGNAVSKVVWFELAADGTILAEQTTEPVTPTPTPEASKDLAYTGSAFAGIAGFALLLTVAGAGVVVAARRRKVSE